MALLWGAIYYILGFLGALDFLDPLELLDLLDSLAFKPAISLLPQI